MAIIYPTIEKIKKLKQKPTNGEWDLLYCLTWFLDDSFSVYFQPFLNGSLPDIIIIHPNKGVLIFEVKDYNLSSYQIVKGKWKLRMNGTILKSPYAQVSFYKNQLYDYIEGLAEDKVFNSKLFGIVQTAVYFHLETEAIAKAFVKDEETKYTETLGCDSLDEKSMAKLNYFRSEGNDHFSKKLYEKFKHFFQPSDHLLELGESINYSPKQLALSKSHPGKVRIKGGQVLGKRLF